MYVGILVCHNCICNIFSPLCILTHTVSGVIVNGATSLLQEFGTRLFFLRFDLTNIVSQSAWEHTLQHALQHMLQHAMQQ